jgi:pilus assembly protein Flp/PilA
MNQIFLRMLLKFQDLTDREDGQDLVEYALLVSLIALVCISGVKAIASSVVTTFTNVSNSLA